MKILLEHIKDENYDKLYPIGEYTESMRLIYSTLGRALFDGSNYFVIKPNYFQWFRDKALVGTFLGAKTPIPTPQFTEVFIKMLVYDDILRQETEIISKSEGLLIKFTEKTFETDIVLDI